MADKQPRAEGVAVTLPGGTQVTVSKEQAALYQQSEKKAAPRKSASAKQDK